MSLLLISELMNEFWLHCRRFVKNSFNLITRDVYRGERKFDSHIFIADNFHAHSKSVANGVNGHKKKMQFCPFVRKLSFGQTDERTHTDLKHIKLVGTIVLISITQAIRVKIKVLLTLHFIFVCICELSWIIRPIFVIFHQKLFTGIFGNWSHCQQFQTPTAAIKH